MQNLSNDPQPHHVDSQHSDPPSENLQQIPLNSSQQKYSLMQSLKNTPTSTLLQSIKSAFENSLCSYKNPGLMLCINAKCQHLAVVCSKTDCQCKTQHRRCFTAQIDGFLERYSQKLNQQGEFLQVIDKIFQNLIDQISQYHENMIKSLKGIFITPQQINFLNIIQKQQFSNLKGKDLKRVFENLSENYEIQQEQTKMNQLIRQLEEASEDTKQQFRKLENTYKEWIKKSEESAKQPLAMFEPLKIKNMDTKILKTDKEVNVLSSFFEKKRVKKFNLLYRASEKNFLMSQFYEKCSNIPNTVILITTTQGKVIGGFTPLVWKTYEFSSYQLVDQSKESFIFSVSEGDKLNLVKPQFATYYLESSPGPRFGKNGYADLWVCDKANSSNQSYVFGQMVYQNGKYSQNSDSYKRFVGGESEYFRVEEWEVFKVQFE